MIQIKEAFRSFITHFHYQIGGTGFGNLTGIDLIGNYVAENTAEHFKTGTVTEQFTGIGNHTGKIAESIR